MHQINKPDVLAELRRQFDLYEAALMANDVPALNLFFWPDSLTIRFGPAECLYGHEAIAAYRAARDATDIRRTLEHTSIVTFGDDFGTANTEYVRLSTGRRGRQSQTWVRFADGWRIVSAHVSLMPEQAD